ncbi:nitroreductase [Aquabacter cavernae]|uniref:nitroreductase n=1 Tax=Aquabacter cavernae TaxID=2496029 RepID=UPI000F8E62D5|nr:nitroreductase [Aquabacter cavernae]
MTIEDTGAHALIRGRHSVRAFRDTRVERDVIQRILATAACSPSGTNMQPWQVYVLTGDARDALVERVTAVRAREPERERGPEPFGEYNYNPEPLEEPYRGRRKAVGWSLYSLLGIAKGDRAASWEAAGRNFEFFGAPVGLIFTLDRYLGMGSWLDLGIFMQSIMLAARGEGLDTCCQAAWRHYHDIVREVAPISDQEIVVCGMSLGHADPAAIANQLRSEREPVEAFARFVTAAPSAKHHTTCAEQCDATS